MAVNHHHHHHHHCQSRFSTAGHVPLPNIFISLSPAPLVSFSFSPSFAFSSIFSPSSASYFHFRCKHCTLFNFITLSGSPCPSTSVTSHCATSFCHLFSPLRVLPIASSRFSLHHLPQPDFITFSNSSYSLLLFLYLCLYASLGISKLSLLIIGHCPHL